MDTSQPEAEATVTSPSFVVQAEWWRNTAAVKIAQVGS